MCVCFFTCVVISTHYRRFFVLQSAPDKLFHWHCSAEIKPTEMKSKSAPFSPSPLSLSLFILLRSISLSVSLSVRKAEENGQAVRKVQVDHLPLPLSSFQADHRQALLYLGRARLKAPASA